MRKRRGGNRDALTLRQAVHQGQLGLVGPELMLRKCLGNQLPFGPHRKAMARQAQNIKKTKHGRNCGLAASLYFLALNKD